MFRAFRFAALPPWLLTCCWLWCTVAALAQGSLSGTVINMQDSTPVAFVSVIDLQTGLGNMAGADGRFSVVCDVGDTLRFSATGFVTHYLVASANSPALKVLLRPANYQLEPVVVHAFDKDYLRDKFKSPSLVIIQKPNVPPQREVGTTKAPKLPITVSPFGIGLTIGWDPVLKDLRRQNKNMVQWQQKMAVLDIVNSKYNRDVVRQNTALTEDMDIDDFMQQCGITPAFVLSHNEYDIIVAIKDAYAHYKTQPHQTTGYRP